jgi:hypothetical protein
MQGKIMNVYKILVGKPEGGRPLGRLRHRWEDSVKWVLGNRVGGVDWTHLAQNRDQWQSLVNIVMNLLVP